MLAILAVERDSESDEGVWEGMSDGRSLAPVLDRLLERGELTPALMSDAMADLVDGRWSSAETAAFLVALRMKGETAQELAAAARAVRGRMVRLETDRSGILDTCGTGGDGTGTFNISTAAAFVVAACGVPVVKHGNRGSSGPCGSADVLEALRISVAGGQCGARRCLNEVGMAFCFAPDFHPALKHVAALRKQLRVRTVFNMLGPLTNPAAARFQLIGVGRVEWLDPMAHAAAELGLEHGFLVHGCDGLDEVTLSGPTHVREVCGGRVEAMQWTPPDFGLRPCALADLRTDGAAASAGVIRGVLAGHDGPPTRVVLANAAAALLATGRVARLADGVALAESAIASGRASELLARLVECSQVVGAFPATGR